MPTATTNRGRQVAGQASDEASNVASVAAERGGEIVRTAKEDAREIAGTVLARASEVTEQVTSQGRSLVEETRSQLQGQARAGTERIAGSLRQYGEQAQALAEGRPQDAPQLTEYAWKAADTCYGVADRVYALADDIEQRGFGGVLEDVQTFARRRPGAFLLGAVAVGFGIGRLVKANSEDEDEADEVDVNRRAAPARSRAVR
jgi:vacuolar-type H+-ATPase subunit H